MVDFGVFSFMFDLMFVSRNRTKPSSNPYCLSRVKITVISWPGWALNGGVWVQNRPWWVRIEEQMQVIAKNIGPSNPWEGKGMIETKSKLQIDIFVCSMIHGSKTCWQEKKKVSWFFVNFLLLLYRKLKQFKCFFLLLRMYHVLVNQRFGQSHSKLLILNKHESLK